MRSDGWPDVIPYAEWVSLKGRLTNQEYVQEVCGPRAVYEQLGYPLTFLYDYLLVRVLVQRGLTEGIPEAWLGFVHDSVQHDEGRAA
jgi:hypothetical protein